MCRACVSCEADCRHLTTLIIHLNHLFIINDTYGVGKMRQRILFCKGGPTAIVMPSSRSRFGERFEWEMSNPMEIRLAHALLIGKQRPSRPTE
jgi:hypothetical protein